MHARATTVLLALVLAPTVATGEPKLDFERDVYPIVKARCIKCHRAFGPNSRKKPKGRLRLDHKGGFLVGGKSRLITTMRPVSNSDG